MTPVALATIISSVSFLASVFVSIFIAGSRWGEIKADLRLMADRITRIEGMFTLRLREDYNAQEDRKKSL
jgi:hypothetical protein